MQAACRGCALAPAATSPHEHSGIRARPRRIWRWIGRAPPNQEWPAGRVVCSACSWQKPSRGGQRRWCQAACTDTPLCGALLLRSDRRSALLSHLWRPSCHGIAPRGSALLLGWSCAGHTTIHCAAPRSAGRMQGCREPQPQDSCTALKASAYPCKFLASALFLSAAV
mgnify:CR=1 FL=1